jgi:hypothetical protein
MFRLSLLSLLLPALACGGYTFVSTVHRDPDGGTLAVRPNASSWEEARRRMHRHCAGDYAIVEQRRVVVGQRTTTEVTEEGERVTTQDVYERQITYVCARAEAHPQSGEIVPATSSGSKG